MVTTHTADTATTLLLLIPLFVSSVTAVALVFLIALAGFTVNLVDTALAMSFPGDASALTTSAFDVGIAADRPLRGRPWSPPST
ncbi:hypothetical protein [Streptomyces sp. NPDC050982]|uniref:hypothetical protein n=1 Tax=Streptomyces sp. NPDC050982 TaxID=3154746 RepID=UPI0033FF6E8E